MVLVSRLEMDGGVGGRWGLPTFQGKEKSGSRDPEEQGDREVANEAAWLKSQFV